MKWGAPYFRHTHATLLLESQVPLKVVSERLGHSSITLTANTYSHVTENIQKNSRRTIRSYTISEELKKFVTYLLLRIK
ncbi:tyrosine-type recombinase/integrase [Fodinisporobacter ferrooxydans]|uniref:Tyrosine-type recombinase/integrase n=1 Tax=Fodinisporobacter ferrooxydans TaxID=2901836 RepID=A0ABY4CUN1_9BACL|nr:tyrosine-type recombinase/integrase [Alicyclobacillaceae bacterium MYW30-H2]